MYKMSKVRENQSLIHLSKKLRKAFVGGFLSSPSNPRAQPLNIERVFAKVAKVRENK